ncbi:MAG TPA: DMT family transporter [Limnochordales bacterium]
MRAGPAGGMRGVTVHPHAILALGVAAVSSAALWVRWSHLPPAILAFYRLLFAALCLWPLAGWQLRRYGFPRQPAGWVAIAAVAGVSLAAHWTVWFASLGMTTVLHATVLVATQPLFVMAASRLLWGQRLQPGQLGALAVCGLGVGGLALGQVAATGGSGPATGSLAGDLLALAAAALASVYLLCGQHVRRWVAVAPYLSVVYSTGALAAASAAAGMGLPLFGWPVRELAVGLGMAAVPTLLGHSAFHAVIARLGATTVATAVLGEPVGATLLAFLLLGEVPSGVALAGAACTLVGLYRFMVRGRAVERGAGARAAG